MQTTSSKAFITGIFKKELKNRFLCEVQIDGKDVVCYVPSSFNIPRKEIRSFTKEIT